MPNYFPQLTNAVIAPAGYAPSMSFKTTIQDTPNGHRTAWAWFGAGLAGYPTGPLYQWKLPYRGLYESERATLESFFAAMFGRLGQFTFLDPAGNLCAYSEDFTNAAWTRSSVAVTTNGGLADPFGGTAASLLTSSSSSGTVTTPVLPSGGASGIVLCASVYAYAASPASIQLALVDSASTVFASISKSLLPLNTWIRVAIQATVSSANPVSFVMTMGSGVALRLFGAQVSPSLGPGGYAKSPGNYGYHPNCRFDMDTISVTKTDFNQNSIDVQIREFFIP